MAKCPHCGNRDPKLIEDNGERPSSPDLTLLCVAPIAPEDSTFDWLPLNQRPATCGMQWDPNQGGE